MEDLTAAFNEGLQVTDATPLEDLMRAEIRIRAVVHAKKVRVQGRAHAGRAQAPGLPLGTRSPSCKMKAAYESFHTQCAVSSVRARTHAVERVSPGAVKEQRFLGPGQTLGFPTDASPTMRPQL